MSRFHPSAWRRPILKRFDAAGAASARTTVVSDPDRLLTEPGIVTEIGARGFQVISFDDPVAFRFVYEGRFRQQWDRGESTGHTVVVRTDDPTLERLPYDLLDEARVNGRELSFSLAASFPTLAPSVVAELDRACLDTLSDAVELTAPGDLGINATRDFVLRHVFEIAPELIKTPADLLRMLLRRHHRAIVLPESFDARLIEWLAARPEWRSWPLERIVPRRDQFLAFLQERWPHFLLGLGHPCIAGREPAPPEIGGPVGIPFDHDDVRVYMDNLFAEGLLVPTTCIPASAVEGTWLRVGVVGDVVEDALLRLERLVTSLEEKLPEQDAAYAIWTQYATNWAECVSLRCQLADAPPHVVERMGLLHDAIEVRFAEWMQTRYAAIHSLPHLPRPITLDKVARYLAHHRHASGRERIALIVVDGLALDQWTVVRESLADFACDESRAFAWVPTLTSVSRQSIFAGEPPYFYGQTIATTEKEPRHWARFWDDQGLRDPAVAYVCQKRQEPDEVLVSRVIEAAREQACKVLGVVVGTVDQMLHGVVTGTGGLHAGVRHWAGEGHLHRLVSELIALGFDVFLTADHGNVEAAGMGKPNVGAIADERGERVHVFPHALTRDNVCKAYPGSMAWPSVGLPGDYLPLIAPGRRAFIRPDTRTVAHGGISIEEVIVPFVHISERT
jgi:hypothetical protein